ncbi:hypothetical protein FACS1894167_04810 [Synergistales bacterium]|nr:hypothetical protein FACS1894167_04810 [Synergistales bacterium]
MCTVIATVLGAAASVMQGMAGQQAANAQAASMENNAKIAEQNAALAGKQGEDAAKRAGIDELRARRDMAMLRGSQRAAFAAAGLDTDSGSAFDAQMSSLSEGEKDIAINQFNAQREKWGHDVEAVNFMNSAADMRAQAGAARAQGRNAFTSGLIGGAAGLVSLAAPKIDAVGSKGVKVGSAYVPPDSVVSKELYKRAPYVAPDSVVSKGLYYR